MGNIHVKSGIKGVQWATVSVISSSIIQIAYTSAMSRLLEPSLFGIMGVVQILIHFTSFFSRFGIGRAFIQKKDIDKNDIRVVYTSSFLLGLISCLSILILSNPISSFFPKIDKSLVDVLRVMSLIFIIRGLIIPSNSLLIRNLRFKLLTQIEIFSSIVFLITGITFALSGYGIWSLVASNIFRSLFELIIYYLNTYHSLIPLFKFNQYKPYFKYGAFFSLTSFLEFISENIIPTFIGKYYGEHKLGLFRQSNNLIHLPLVYVTQSVNKVAFPILSKYQNEIQKLNKAYHEALHYNSLLLFPACIGAAVASHELVVVVLGSKFIEAVPILRILCVSMCFQYIIPSANVILDSTGKLKGKMIFQIFYLVLISIMVYIFKTFDILIILSIMALFTFIKSVFYIFMANKILKSSWNDVLASISRGIILSLIIAVFIYFVTKLLYHYSISPFVLLPIQMVSGLILLVLSFIFYPSKSIVKIWTYLFTKKPSIQFKLHPLFKKFKWYKEISVH